ncbi:MAG: T9SS type A sorting domain-containing protein [Salibacteraceae bacterium]
MGCIAFNTTVFFNPANEQLKTTFNLPKDSEVNASLTTLAGTVITENLSNRTLMSKGTSTINCTTDQLPTGVYIMTIQTEFGTQHHRLLLTH